MKKSLLIIAAFILVIALALNGCQRTEPYIKDVSASLSTSENQIAAGDSFKLFIAIQNPTRITFTPYMEVEFNTSDFDANNHDINLGRRLELESIEALGEKNYFLVFEVEAEAQVAKYPFVVSLYGNNNAEVPLGLTHEEYVNVAEQII